MRKGYSQFVCQSTSDFEDGGILMLEMGINVKLGNDLSLLNMAL